MIIKCCDKVKVGIDQDLIERIDAFANKIIYWNKSLKLVANSTLSDLWGWHFLDSLSLLNLLKGCEFKIFDFGSGGGVISIPLIFAGFDITLVERSSNKAFFIENIVQYPNIQPFIDDYLNSVIIVRGVTTIKELLSLLRGAYRLILFKSLNYLREIREAHLNWDFTYKAYGRIGKANGVILVLDNIQYKKK